MKDQPYHAEEPEAPVKPDYTFDMANMSPATLVKAHQEGNYLVGVTDNGTTFRQHIPVDKMVSKNEKGEWILIPLRHA